MFVWLWCYLDRLQWRSLWGGSTDKPSWSRWTSSSARSISNIFHKHQIFSHVYVIFLPVAAPLGVLELPVGALPLADPLHGPVLDVELHGLGEGDGALGVVAHLLQHVHGQHGAPGRVRESTNSLNACRMRWTAACCMFNAHFCRQMIC